MATTKVKAEDNKDALEGMNEALGRSEQFIEKNQKTLLIALAAVIVIVGGVLLYNNKVVLPREQKAAEQIFKGEQYFAADSLRLALEGDAVDYIGFEAIIKDYSGTKTAKLAKAYAGLCYKAQGDYKTAISYLNKVKTSDLVVNPALTGAIGDCYVELGETQKATAYFEKAAKSGNSLLAPIYLMKAGRAYEALGQWSKALKVYETIKAEYPNSLEGTEVEKYIERAKCQK